MKKIIHVVAGGPDEFLPDLSDYAQKDAIWIGVDKGVQLIIQHGLHPDLAVGDFDSISPEDFLRVKRLVPSLRQFKPEKDETDMELAILTALEMTPSVIKIFGATGGRLDHLMANIMMLGRFKQHHPDTSFEMIDTQNSLSVFVPGFYQIGREDEKKYVSFIPVFSDVNGLTLKGFKFPLTQHHVPLGSSLCISNELIQETGHFSFEKGILMMIRSKD
ncbi:thiamine diphosphokinase [Siminovitchia sediminis]|uniref:Thiamine diphosphokinase n=1 Tax=Siminovitchia sediminis TaxID=1274353 RepID=A0ABW4KDH0_9BACI